MVAGHRRVVAFAAPLTRIMVTGSRGWTDDAVMGEALGYWLFCEVDITIIHGGARGADEMADRMARTMAIPVEVFKADWSTFGKGAGPIRNREMLKTKPEMVLAFWDGKSSGTRDAITAATQMRIPVHIYPPSTSRRSTDPLPRL